MPTGVENPSQRVVQASAPQPAFYTAPTTGQTVTVPQNGLSQQNVVIEPAATLATLTLAFPASVRDGQVVSVQCTQIITALTLTGGTFVGTSVTALTAGQVLRYVYVLSQNKWYPL